MGRERGRDSDQLVLGPHVNIAELVTTCSLLIAFSPRASLVTPKRRERSHISSDSSEEGGGGEGKEADSWTLDRRLSGLGPPSADADQTVFVRRRFQRGPGGGSGREGEREERAMTRDSLKACLVDGDHALCRFGATLNNDGSLPPPLLLFSFPPLLFLLNAR